jgi:dipeptidyl-peptidase-3
VKLVRRDGKSFVQISNIDKARQGVAEILERLQTIKSTGDERAATEIFDRFGTHLDPAIRKEISARAERLRIPRVTVFVFPRLEPVLSAGNVVDATLHLDEDLTAQQLRYRKERFSTSIP